MPTTWILIGIVQLLVNIFISILNCYNFLSKKHDIHSFFSELQHEKIYRTLVANTLWGDEKHYLEEFESMTVNSRMVCIRYKGF